MTAEARQTAVVMPFAIAQWAADEWVSTRLAEAGLSSADIVSIDPSTPISSTGSSLISWAARCPHCPGLDVTRTVIRYFLDDRACDPNVPDFYGRTPLVHFLQGYAVWRHKVDYGLDVISAFLRHKADANVLFTPNYVGEVGCQQWRLVHHCMFSHILDFSNELASAVLDLLDPHWDKALLDSENRGIAEYERIPKVISARERRQGG